MENNNILFKIFKTKDLVYGSNNSFSHFGWEGTGVIAFSSYAMGYQAAAELIFGKMEKGTTGDVDTLIYPLCFNHRHCMEILLKRLYIKYSRENEERIKKFLNANHNLDKVWEDVKPILKKNIDRVGSNVDIEFLEDCVKAMQEFDDKSMKMRYPITKQLEASNQKEVRLDFKHFHNCMLKFYKKLDQVDRDIDNQVSYQAPQEEYDLFLTKYRETKSSIEGFINILKPYIVGEKEFNRTKEWFEREKEKKLKLFSYLEELSSDKFIMIKTLYGAGRDVNNHGVKFSLVKEDRLKDFVNFCLLCPIKYDREILEHEIMDILQYYPSSIVSNLEKSMSLLGD